MVQSITNDSDQLGVQRIELGMPDFRQVAVRLSKLLVQVWLNEGEGPQFKEDITEYGLKGALQEQGIFFPDKWLKGELDADSFVGSIEFDESCTWNSPNAGLELVWKIPYAPWPENAVTEDELKEWIGVCNQWIGNKEYENPDAPFPAPRNPYIPLSTT